MRRVGLRCVSAVGVLALGVLALGVLAATVSGQQVPVFRGSTDLVPVYVTVTDKDGRLVTTLGRDDFTVYDNGRKQPLTLFDDTPQPIHLIVMLDVSGSMYGNLPLLRVACQQLFANLGPDDKARVGTFGKEVAISPTFTADASELLAGVPAEIPPDSPTPLWSALAAALDGFKGIDGRRVVLVLSDGKDSGPIGFRGGYVSVLEVAERAQRDGVMLYAVGLRSRSGRNAARNAFNMGAGLTDDLPDPGLGNIAIDTGGGYFELRSGEDLAVAFTRVVSELHSQYLLGFAPTSRDGRKHKVEVRLSMDGLTPRARKNYTAPKEP